MRTLLRLLLRLFPVTLVVALAQDPVVRVRTPVRLPDIPGYVTLKCDFHIHTVFSDGLVWPTVRVEEAWREGLDAIAITDHIEYQPHKADVATNHNRSYEIARAAGADLDILVVKGSEITRQMPPGHLNALFLTNSTPLAVTNWLDAVEAAHRQGAFIFWDHPGWSAQTTNGRVLWYPDHTALLERGLLHGIEVVNSREYYPEAQGWALAKHLAMLSNSDIHDPLNLVYQVHATDHRPLTLVFARERTLDSLREALFARQTAVYVDRRLIGEERFLRPLFDAGVQLRNPSLGITSKQKVLLQVHNHTDVPFQLEATQDLAEVAFPQTLTLAPNRTVLLPLTGRSTTLDGTRKLRLPFRVTNLLVAPGEPLAVTIDVEVAFRATNPK
jgi:hypothetical protein